MAKRVMYSIKDENDQREFWAIVREYILRPERVFYAWRFTGLPYYRDAAWQMFQGIVKSCKTEHVFASITGVGSGQIRHRDEMESFFLAETLKYLYLTFVGSDALDMDEWVFNTEAHPVKVWDAATVKKFSHIFDEVFRR
jgi:mannosyl-oligosaccharide alpha-1,2-mannosidase